MDTSRKKYDFVYNFTAAGKNITEVINVKERGNQIFKDKFVLVMLVLGLLTIVAAAGAEKSAAGSGRFLFGQLYSVQAVITGAWGYRG